jgi:hypothetical protein
VLFLREILRRYAPQNDTAVKFASKSVRGV